jgi:hypothetical protein
MAPTSFSFDQVGNQLNSARAISDLEEDPNSGDMQFHYLETIANKDNLPTIEMLAGIILPFFILPPRPGAPSVPFSWTIERCSMWIRCGYVA